MSVAGCYGRGMPRLVRLAVPCAVAALALSACGSSSSTPAQPSTIRQGANTQQVSDWNTSITRDCDTEHGRAVYLVAGGTGTAVASVPADCATLPPQMRLRQEVVQGVAGWNVSLARYCDPQTGALLYVVAGGMGVGITAVDRGCAVEAGLGH